MANFESTKPDKMHHCISESNAISFTYNIARSWKNMIGSVLKNTGKRIGDLNCGDIKVQVLFYTVKNFTQVALLEGKTTTIY